MNDSLAGLVGEWTGEIAKDADLDAISGNLCERAARQRCREESCQNKVPHCATAPIHQNF